eukprot:TRINITY_DN2708_c0_g1_i6.p1 TRINITY_DN2708_c0_g1~~TRINITY_DN2708_c0_g1_i6.p1  ORF type:complete len:467 (-),score=115.85 TRINITY_DN2708_c0_g1_i6:1144-2544(-)
MCIRDRYMGSTYFLCVYLGFASQKMNILRSVFGSSQKEKLEDHLRIYFDETLGQYTTVHISETTTAKQILDEKIPKNLRQMVSERAEDSKEGDDMKVTGLLLAVRIGNSAEINLKRRVHFFETPLKLIQSKASNETFFFILKKFLTLEARLRNKERERVDNNFMDNLYIDINPDKSEKYERAGNLMKQSKNNTWKKKYFVLYKDSLQYFPDNKAKKCSFIPLEYAKASIKDPRQHFEIKTKDKTYYLKSNSDLDAQGWVVDINLQAKMVTENIKMDDTDRVINNNEKHHSFRLQADYVKLYEEFESFITNKRMRTYFFDFVNQKIKDDPLINPLFELFEDILSFTRLLRQDLYKQALNVAVEIVERLKKEDLQNYLSSKDICSAQHLSRVFESFEAMRSKFLKSNDSLDIQNVFENLYNNIIIFMNQQYFTAFKENDKAYMKILQEDFESWSKQYDFPKPALVRTD